MNCGNKGKLLTFTVLQSVPSGFEAPLIIGMIELTDGTRLLCNGDCKEHELEIGMDVIINEKDDKSIFKIEG